MASNHFDYSQCEFMADDRTGSNQGVCEMRIGSALVLFDDAQYFGAMFFPSVQLAQDYRYASRCADLARCRRIELDNRDFIYVHGC